jgi:hypothetical protein
MTDQDFNEVLQWISRELVLGIHYCEPNSRSSSLSELIRFSRKYVDNLDVTGLRLFCDLDLDEMPLFVNDETWRREVAKWRLERAK